MEKEKFSYPVSLRRMQITDKFWKNEMELVRTEVIPYQWNALNDKVEGAAPSYCMHKFLSGGGGLGWVCSGLPPLLKSGKRETGGACV